MAAGGANAGVGGAAGDAIDPELTRRYTWEECGRIVAAGTLLHLPSGDTRAFDANATEALFAPNGDVIVGETDGSLVRFCRTSAS